MRLFFLFVLTLALSSVRAQLPEQFTEPIPLDTGEAGEPAANRILFFPHPAVPDSAVNFQEAPSSIAYGIEQEVSALDLIGTPGFSVGTDMEIDSEYMPRLLADPSGLCFQNLLINLFCDRDWVLSDNRHLPSWALLLADLRNYQLGEARVAGLPAEIEDVTLSGRPFAAPYNQFGLSPLIATRGEEPIRLDESPPAICYDITYAEDWIACPVFGKIYVRGYTTLRPVTIGGETVEIQNPVVIYRLDPEDGRYHLAGYLANPISPLHYDYYDETAPNVINPDRRVRQGRAYFPMAIAAGNFVHGGITDIAVMGTATLPYSICDEFLDKMAEAGLPDFPWGRDCTYGLVWARMANGWELPVRELFDSTHVLIGAPKIYAMATGWDAGEVRLFAASNAPSADGRFYILKYFDLETIESTRPGVGELVPPQLIPVTPPAEDADFGPFRIITTQVNMDGLADFAVTWKKTQDKLANTENRVWQGTYSSYFSVFLSRLAAGGVVYDQLDFEIPQAELAAIASGEQGGQSYLLVGNQKRVQVEGEGYHAFVHLFPISGGIIDNLNTRAVRVSSQQSEQADAPGVADLTASPGSFVIGAALRDPILPAPESCNSSGGVYGHLWLWEVQTEGGILSSLDVDRDGVPNRCECSVLPDADNDPDLDELANVEGCDSCPEAFNVDLELNEAGLIVGDGVADACDNCPPTRCELDENFVCTNPSQPDRDGDGVGDTCDGCPDHSAFAERRIYYYDAPAEDFDIREEEFCGYCANGYLRPSGEFIDMGWRGDDSCAEPIVNYLNSSLGNKDLDGDGVPNERDNCVYSFNPPGPRYIGTSGDRFAGQLDSDHDGSGDECDCEEAGLWDDCDGDGVPNRFDIRPNNPDLAKAKSPDSIYDPYAAYIAVRNNLRPAQAEGINIFSDDPVLFDFPQIRSRQLPPTPPVQVQVCGYNDNTWPGSKPCDHRGRSPREVTVVLPAKTATEPLEPCLVGENPDCAELGPPPSGPGDGPVTTGRNVAQFCVAEVGRRDPKTAAAVDWEQTQIIEANNRIRAITGIEDFDIVVGSEGGHIHYECAFLAGAYPGISVAQSAGIIPDVSGNVAPYAVIQTAGLPPHLKYEHRPDPALAIRPPQALLIGPVGHAAHAAEEGTSPPLSLALANLAVALPGLELSQIPGERVQFGDLRQNVNGRLVYKVLTSESDFAAEGTFLAVEGPYSLMVMDILTPPEPWSKTPVERRRDKIPLLIQNLEAKVAQWRAAGWEITPEIYHGLDWEEAMRLEFLIVQNTVPEAIEASRSLIVSSTAMPEGTINRAVLPAYVRAPRFAVSGGCGCYLPTREFSILSILYLLCLLAPVPVLMYYRRRLRK